MTAIILKNGVVVDPLNGVDCEKMDICIQDGRIVEKVNGKAEEIDCSGKLIMAGGVDIHSHIAGSKVNAGRIFRPEDSLRKEVSKNGFMRSGTGWSVPSTFITGYQYAQMGYTTVMTPAMPPLMARHTHEELHNIPIIDKAAYPLFDGNWLVMKYIREGNYDKLAAYVSWLLRATRGYVVKVVNPGGTEAWGWGKNLRNIKERVPYFDVSPEEMIKGLAEVNERLGLPHQVHLHPNNLGRPGNFETTLETFDIPKGAANGRESLHVTHCQFHSYGGTSWKDFESRAEDIADYVNKNDHVRIDAGFVTLDETTTMTADGPMEYMLHTLTHFKWVNNNVEMETAPGVTPFIYSRKNPVQATQWCIGLELALLIKDPTKILLTTDAPNGGPFTRYPRIMAWLMSSKYRAELMETAHKGIEKSAVLPTIERELTFSEIAAMSRSGPAQALGMKDKGHLGVGAQADIAVYDLDPAGMDPGKDYQKIEEAFGNAFLTLKDGNVVVKNGKVAADYMGRTYWVNAQVDQDLEAEVLKDVEYNFKRFYSVNLNNYPVQEKYMHREEEVRIDASDIR